MIAQATARQVRVVACHGSPSNPMACPPAGCGPGYLPALAFPGRTSRPGKPYTGHQATFLQPREAIVSDGQAYNQAVIGTGIVPSSVSGVTRRHTAVSFVGSPATNHKCGQLATSAAPMNRPLQAVTIRFAARPASSMGTGTTSRVPLLFEPLRMGPRSPDDGRGQLFFDGIRQPWE